MKSKIIIALILFLTFISTSVIADASAKANIWLPAVTSNYDDSYYTESLYHENRYVYIGISQRYDPSTVSVGFYDGAYNQWDSDQSAVGALAEADYTYTSYFSPNSVYQRLH